jgi:fibronectin type 3 domain-containing protein
MPFVTLSWSASTSSVTGYNIYRGTAPGSYTKLNPSVDASTTYTDNTVVPGTTYYYAATSVSTSGQESGFSSPLQVAVP